MSSKRDMPSLKPDSTQEFLLEGGRVGVLLVHGFSSNPAEMRGLGDYLHKRGYTVLGIRLAGHGTSPEDMKHTSLNDWMQSAKRGASLLLSKCNQVYAVGQSMGGLICLKLALDLPLRGVVLLSPPMFRPDWRWSMLPVARHLIRWYVIGGGADPSHYAPPYTVKAYPRVPTKSLGEFLKLVAEARRFSPQVHIPVLLQQGKLDGIAPASSGPELLALLGSSTKQLKRYPNSNHVLTVDADRDKVWRDIGDFIETARHTAPKRKIGMPAPGA